MAGTEMTGRLLRLTNVEIEGFKSFRDKMVIGPLADFTCIIGPNGCGKSVVGEAVAFALGGNRKMLRAGSLAGLINQERRAEGCKTAQVTLHMDLLPSTAVCSPKDHKDSSPAQHTHMHEHRQTSVGAADNTAAGDSTLLDQVVVTDSSMLLDTGSTVDTARAVCRKENEAAGLNMQQEHHMQDAAGQQEDQHQQQQWLGIRRTLRGSSTVSHIKRPDRNNWVPISQADLQAELAAYNIQTEVVDRYIVTQSRQAVDVGDAVKLVKHLELLTGTGDYEDRIQEQGKTIELLTSRIDHTQQQISSLETEREQLALQVAQWQKVQQMEVDFTAAKVQLLQDQQTHGSRLIAYQKDQVSKVRGAASAASAKLKDLQHQEQLLQQQESSISQQLGNCKKKEVNLCKKVEKLTAAAASSKVQLSSAESAMKDQQALAQKMQARIDKLLSEEAGHKQHIAELHQQAHQLQQARTAAQQLLAAEQKAAAAAAAEDAACSSATGHPSNRGPSAAVLQLQQQLAAVEAEVAQLQATKAAAAIKATRAAVSISEAAKSIQEIDSAADKVAAELLAAQESVAVAAAAVDAGVTAAQEAEQQWKDAHWQERNLQDQLQTAEADLQQYHTAGPPPGGHHHHPTAAGAWPAYDAAVQHLQQQLPPRTFFGRLCNCIAIKDPTGAAAINTAIQEVCDTNRTLIVSDRRAASAVIDYFRQQRIGTVQCKILAELASSSSSYDRMQAGGFNTSGGCARPLLEYVATAVGLPTGFQALLNQLLGSWLLVTDRQEANRLLHLRKNLVTRSGEVFKADGEIVVNMARQAPSSSSSNPYALQVGQPAPIAPPSSAAAAAQPANAAAAAAAAKAVQKEVQQLQKQAAAAQQQAAAADQQLRSARTDLLLKQQQHAAAERLVQGLTQQQQAQAARAAQMVPALQQQLLSAQVQRQQADEALVAAASAVQQAEQQQHQLVQQLQALTGSRQQRKRGASASSSGTRGSGVVGNLVDNNFSMLSAFSKAAEAAAAADADVADVWQQADKVKQQQSRAGSRAAALRKELEKVQKAAEKQQEVAKMQAKLDSLADQLLSAQEDLKTTQSDKVLLTNKLKPLRKQLVAASKARTEAENTAQTYQAELQQQRHYLASIQSEQQQREAALQVLLPQQQQQDTDMQDAVDAKIGAAAAAPAEAEQQAADMDVDATDCTATDDDAAKDVEGVSGARSNSRGGRKGIVPKKQQRCMTRGRRAAIVDDSSDSGTDSDKCDQDNSKDDSSSSSSDEEAADQTAGRSARKPPKPQQQQQHKVKPEVSVAALIKQGKQLQQQEQQLNEQEEHLQQQRSRVNDVALDRDLATLQALESALGQLQQLEQQHAKAVAAREQLLDGRYTKLLSVLQRLNAKLDDVYKQLTGGAGSAYCAYTQERRLLFSQGVTLHVQPDGKTWRQFSMLSGGQQALATLALSFALQALSPSPFYFFDEVDCALDSLAAGQVAAYVKAQCKGGLTVTTAVTGTETGGNASTGAAGNKTSCNSAAGSDAPAVAAQYLLVSHRPAVFESASCLLGVYSNGRGSSATVVAHFPDLGASS